MPRRDPLDLFLDGLAEVRAIGAGTAETSFYPAVHATLNAVGDALTPKVLCLHHPSGRKAGIPDFGLFERTSFRRGEAPEWRAGLAPERGIVEVKGADHNMATLLASKQVKEDYLPAYGLVLATNLRQWRLLDAGGVVRESFDLAPDSAAFWALVSGTRTNPQRKRFGDFLQRCLLWRAPLARPKDVAFFLASYARDALALMEEQATLPALGTLRGALEKSLGIAFDAKDGEHLFRSTLVQTLFYGLFSAWAAHEDARPFDWRSADYDLHLPVVRLLYNQVRAPQALRPLGLEPLLDAATATLARVDRDAFFSAFDAAHAVQYFYEPFLEFFDPDLRKQLGVWYTPPEIVEYMVERVDRVLREELGRADGLADPDVWVLDPCCGTGSYVVQVLKRIRSTLAAKGLGDLAAERLKEAARTRVVGFEIMTAPLIIAHWQVGQLLRGEQAPLADNERAAIYLTNALTGWSHNAQQPDIHGFDELLDERTEADAVKRHRRILVVIGNPPYNAYAGTTQGAEAGLVDGYKVGLQAKWGVKKFNLDDLFVRFYRVAEQRIAQTTGEGIVCFVTNFSWLSRPSYVVMRERLLSEFDRIWIDNLNGDSRETGKVTPDGRPDPSIFSTEMNREGIRVGTAIALFSRRHRRHTAQDPPDSEVFYRDFWGENKKSSIANSLRDDVCTGQYAALSPNRRNRFALRPAGGGSDYPEWVPIPEIARIAPLAALLEKRGGALQDIDRDKLESRMKIYFDPSKTLTDVAYWAPGLARSMDGKDPEKLRRLALGAERFAAERIAPTLNRPFDLGYAYITNASGIWNRARPELQHVVPDAVGFLLTRTAEVAKPYGFPTYWSRRLSADRAMDEHAYLVPAVENLSGAPRPNLSVRAVSWLANLGLPGKRALTTAALAA